MHNAEKPNPSASIQEAGVRGIAGIVRHSNRKQPSRSQSTPPTQSGSSWGGIEVFLKARGKSEPLRVYMIRLTSRRRSNVDLYRFDHMVEQYRGDLPKG